MIGQGRWVTIKPEEYDEPHEIGLEVLDEATHISPYDIPLAVRALYNQNSRSIEFEFRYMTDEDVTDVRLGDLVKAHIGNNSGRIVGMFVDLDELPHRPSRAIGWSGGKPAVSSGTILATLREAFEHLFAGGGESLFKIRSKVRRRRGNIENYHVAWQVLFDKGDEVVGSVGDQEQ